MVHKVRLVAFARRLAAHGGGFACCFPVITIFVWGCSGDRLPVLVQQLQAFLANPVVSHPHENWDYSALPRKVSDVWFAEDEVSGMVNYKGLERVRKAIATDGRALNSEDVALKHVT
jgi:hypothetical protein